MSIELTSISEADRCGIVSALAADPTPLANDLDKLASSPTIGEVVVLTDEANRVERFIGLVGLAGFRIPDVQYNDAPFVVGELLNGKPTFEMLPPEDLWYADWGGNVADSWSIGNGDDGVVWTSDEDVASPLDVETWTKVFEEPDEEEPIYHATPTLVAAPAANQDNWSVLRNTIALTVDNYSTADLSVNSISCPIETATFVGWVSPTIIPINDSATVTSVAFEGGEVVASFDFSGSLPYAFAPRSDVRVFVS